MSNFQGTVGWMYKNKSALQDKLGTCPWCGSDKTTPFCGWNNGTNSLISLCCKRTFTHDELRQKQGEK